MAFSPLADGDSSMARSRTDQLERFVASPNKRQRRNAPSQYYHIDQGMNDALVIGGAVHIDEPKLLLPIYAKVSVLYWLYRTST
jgi:hypothetical protein